LNTCTLDGWKCEGSSFIEYSVPEKSVISDEDFRTFSGRSNLPIS